MTTAKLNTPTKTPSDGNFAQKFAIPLLTLLETILLVTGLYYLGFADGGLVGWLKLGVFGLAAWLVAYLVNHIAIERGVPLAADGAKLAAPLSGAAILVVGTAFFIATFAGLTTPKVEEYRLSAHVEELSRYADDRTVFADKASELVPIMQALAQNLATEAVLEGETGRGPVARTLEGLFDRADNLSAQMTISLGVRDEVLAHIGEIKTSMNEIVADEALGIWERRTALRLQHGALLTLLAELEKAIPVSLVTSYASELNAGIIVPGRDEATTRINAKLGGLSGGLIAALEHQYGVAGEPPHFPEKTGALDSFVYASKFVHILLITFTVDILFPILLFVLTLMTITRRFPRAPKPQRPISDYQVLTAEKAIDTSDLPQPGRENRAGKSKPITAKRHKSSSGPS